MWGCREGQAGLTDTEDEGLTLGGGGVGNVLKMSLDGVQLTSVLLENLCSYQPSSCPRRTAPGGQNEGENGQENQNESRPNQVGSQSWGGVGGVGPPLSFPPCLLWARPPHLNAPEAVPLLP